MKTKNSAQLLAQRERMLRMRDDLKNRVNNAQCRGRCVDESVLKRWKRHKLLCKDIIAAVDAHFSKIAIEELPIAAE